MFREVKRIFDPAEHLQSGQDRRRRPGPDRRGTCGRRAVAGCRRPAAGRQRRPPDAEPSRPSCANLVELQLNWDPARVADAVAGVQSAAATAARRRPTCGCARSSASLPAEEASPRAKANLIRGVLTGTLDLNR